MTICSQMMLTCLVMSICLWHFSMLTHFIESRQQLCLSNEEWHLTNYVCNVLHCDIYLCWQSLHMSADIIWFLWGWQRPCLVIAKCWSVNLVYYINMISGYNKPVAWSAVSTVSVLTVNEVSAWDGDFNYKEWETQLSFQHVKQEYLARVLKCVFRA